MGEVMVLLEVLMLAESGKVLFDSFIEESAIHLCKAIRKAPPSLSFGLTCSGLLMLRLWLDMHSFRWGDPCIEHLLEFYLLLIISFQGHLEYLLPHKHADL